MESIKKTILVPWDFTEVAENAMLHALRLVKTIKTSITLLHIVSKQKDIEPAQAELDKIAAGATEKYNVKITGLVREGNIFSSIKEVADEEDAILVVMGTHGIKGMQKLTGSWALKVIANSVIPFIVVQQKPVHDEFAKMVLPIDFSVENKEKLRWANYIATYFKTKIYLFIPYVQDENLLRKTKANLLFAKNYLEEKVIEYEIQVSQSKSKYTEQTLEFAKEVNADMILIMTTKQPSLTDYMFAADEQQIIANSGDIPVMCVNPRTDKKKYTGFH